MLRQSDRRKDEFLATLAHELRNPLAPLHNALNVLQLSRHNPEINQQAHQIMTRQVKQMVRLVDDLLDVSRITRNNIELRKESVEFGTIMRDAVETSRPLIDAKKHTLTVNIPEGNIHLHADGMRMTQIFSNLINNAGKYTPAGGTIRVEAEVKGRSLVARIRDSGIGIERKMLPHIFDMFMQVDNSLERSQGGLGIGLTLVRNLVDRHDGTIEVKSEGLGKGSEFIVTLPIGASPAAKKPANATFDVTDRPLSVLVVDDNEPSAKTIGWMLELLGHNPTLLLRGEKVVEVATALKPDVILLDIGMPGLNGYDICRMLRELPQFNDTVLIAQTGWGQQQDKDMAREAGFDHHLVKPVDSERLQSILKNEISRQEG